MAKKWFLALLGMGFMLHTNVVYGESSGGMATLPALDAGGSAMISQQAEPYGHTPVENSYEAVAAANAEGQKTEKTPEIYSPEEKQPPGQPAVRKDDTSWWWPVAGRMQKVNYAGDVKYTATVTDMKNLAGEMQAAAAAGGGIIILAGDAATVNLNGVANITITEDTAITLYAEKPLTITTAPGARHFNFDFPTGRSLILTLDNIYLDGKNNGGGIALNGGRLNFAGGTIGNCKNPNGGAIFSTGGEVILSGGKIFGNEATRNGGGIFAQGTRVDIRINGGEISQNLAGNAGGGLYTEGANIAVLMEDGILAENKAMGPDGGNGGGIYANGVEQITTVLDGKQIRGNNGNRPDTGINQQDGTAVLVTLRGGQLSGNEATGDGGGIYAASTGKTAVAVYGGAVSLNKAGANGGGVYIKGTLSEVHTAGGEISRNEAAKDGGGLYAYGFQNLTADLDGGETAGNKANRHGGGFYTYGAGMVTVNVNGGKIRGNEAGADGGGLYATGAHQTNMNINNGEILGNRAGQDGGGGSISGTPLANLTYTGGVTGNNRATGHGGGFKIEGTHNATANIRGGEIHNNEAGENGGGFYTAADREAASLTIAGGTIRYNVAGNGGGLYATGNEADILMAGGETYCNEAQNNGGGIYAGGGVAGITLQGGLISGNEARNNGGGVYVADPGGKTTHILGGEVSYNTAGGHGGGIYTDINSLTVTGGFFHHNLAAEGHYTTPADRETYKTFTAAEVTEPFGHILNNFDVVYSQREQPSVYFLAFQRNDGTPAEHARVEFQDVGEPLGSGFSGNPLWAGHVFQSWNTRPTGGGTTLYKSTPVGKSSARVYAQWADAAGTTENPLYPADGSIHENKRDTTGTTYTVRFETGGHGSAAKVFAAGEKMVKPEDPTREGYRFTGWYTDRPETVYDFNLPVMADTTLYAGWEPVAVKPDRLPAFINGYPDGNFFPDQPVTRGEAAAMAYRLLREDTDVFPPAAVFTDVAADAWYSDAVRVLAQKAILTGYPGGAFRPDTTVTRAEFTAMALRLAGIPAENPENRFHDVPAAHWAAGFIEAAANRGIVQGYDGGNFGPDTPVTRGEAVAILNRVLAGGITTNQAAAPFQDVPPDHWAYGDILAATGYGE